MSVTIKKGTPTRSDIPFARLALPYGVWLLLEFGSGSGAFHTFGKSWFAECGPGFNPPWYFIGEDLLSASWALGAAVLLFLFVLATERWLGANVWAVLAMGMFSFVTKVGAGVNIFLNTTDVWHRSMAASQWVTFAAYRRSQGQAESISLAVSVFVAALCIWRYAQVLRKTGRVA